MDGDAGNIRTAVDILQQRFGDRLTTNQTIRERHGTDESYHAPKAPDAVVFPETREEVQEIVRICAEHRTPIVPYGVGTSLEGHIAALRGGVSIDLGQMNAYCLRIRRAHYAAQVPARQIHRVDVGMVPLESQECPGGYYDHDAYHGCLVRAVCHHLFP